ncbi:site-specific DNA-methyltransferase [Streptosporangium sp. NPDC049078]|uniref:DNA-methyltransferase n=1 Tax=Streptosporangium sp. NPDC049078 TaxID=3155767 RepID=UPI0034295DC1
MTSRHDTERATTHNTPETTYHRTADIPLDALTPFPGNAKRGDVNAILASLRRNTQYRSLVVREIENGPLIVLAGNHTMQAFTAHGPGDCGQTAKIGDVEQPCGVCRNQAAWELTARCEIVRCDDDTARRINLADNRTPELGAYDNAALADLLDALGGDLDGTGYTRVDLDELEESLRQAVGGLGGNPADEDRDEVPEPPAQVVTKPGDVWLLGPHRIICGDCRDPKVLDRLLAGASINMAFTSPPYASQRTYDESSGFKPIPPDEYADWFDAVQAGVRAHLAVDGSWFVNIKEHCEDGQRHLYVKDLTIAHVRQWGWLFVDELCWVDTKNGVPGGWQNRFKDAWEPIFHFTLSRKVKFNAMANAVPSSEAFEYAADNPKSTTGSGFLGTSAGREFSEGLARPSNVMQIAASADRGLGHSAMFPVPLPAWFIRAYSDEGDVVFDPFMGSGTTLVAAHTENRVAYGTEISPGYVDVICRRFQLLTGTQPINEATGQPVDFTQE